MHEIIDIGNTTLIFSPFKDLETASLGIFLKIGSRHEKNSLKGAAHFLEHLLFKGSKKYSHKDIKREIEGRGGLLNGFTSQEFTGYYAHFLNKNLTPTLDILMDMIFSPLIKKNDVEKERKVILEEIKMYNDLPSSRSLVLLDKLLWKGHELGEEVIGNFSTVERIKREDLVHFKEAYYRTECAVVSCAGNFDVSGILRLLKERLTVSNIKRKIGSRPAPKPMRGIHINVEHKKLEQTHLCIGFRSVSYASNKRFIVELLNVILGANMSSRLFEEVREKRALCYDISSDARKYKDTGAFIVHVGLDKTKISVALMTILGELQKLKEHRVAPGELSRAKDFILGQISMALERPQGQMFYVAESFLTMGKIYSLSEIKKEIERIDSAAIQKIAQDIFQFQNVCVSCVGDVQPNTELSIKKALERC